MSPLIASTLDEIYESFLLSLPASESAPARSLAHTLRLAPSPDAPWSRVLREAAMPGLPLFLAEGLPGAFTSTVRDAARAHLLGFITALASRRLHDGTVTASPELAAVLEALRRARDEALGRLGANLPPGPLTDATLAEQDATAAQAEARDLLGRRAPVSLEAYERLMLRAHATAFPAPLALAAVAGCNEARKRVLHQAVKGLAMSLQARAATHSTGRRTRRAACPGRCASCVAAWAARCPRTPPSCAAWCRAAAWWCGCWSAPASTSPS